MFAPLVSFVTLIAEFFVDKLSANHNSTRLGSPGVAPSRD